MEKADPRRRRDGVPSNRLRPDFSGVVELLQVADDVVAARTGYADSSSWGFMLDGSLVRQSLLETPALGDVRLFESALRTQLIQKSGEPRGGPGHYGPNPFLGNAYYSSETNSMKH